MKIMLVEEISKSKSILSSALIEEGYDEPIVIDHHDDIFKKASDAKIDMLVMNIEEPDRNTLTQLKYINDVFIFLSFRRN